MTSKTF